MNSETSIDDPGEMHKRRITLDDGRYLIFFTFGDEGESADVRDQAARTQPETEKENSV